MKDFSKNNIQLQLLCMNVCYFKVLLESLPCVFSLLVVGSGYIFPLLCCFFRCTPLCQNNDNEFELTGQNSSKLSHSRII